MKSDRPTERPTRCLEAEKGERLSREALRSRPRPIGHNGSRKDSVMVTRMVMAWSGAGLLLVSAQAAAQAAPEKTTAPATVMPAALPKSLLGAPGPSGAAASRGMEGRGVGEGAATLVATTTMDDTAPTPIPFELLQPTPGGLTSEDAGKRARATSWSAASAQASLQGAEARVEEASAAYVPRLTGIAKYTRLSKFTPPSFSFFPSGNVVVAQGQGPIGPGNPAMAVPVGKSSFPFFVLDNWLLQGTITVPVSDYFLKIEQNYTAATQSAEAARWDVMTARAASDANGRLAYYAWLNARGAVIVAVQTLDDQKRHLRDARNQFAVGNASKADVLRAETAVSAAELALVRARNMADLAEKQLRVAMHVSGDQALAIGEDLDGPLAPVQGSVGQMTSEALASRPELKSIRANVAAAREQVKAAGAQRWPSLSAFADGIEGNPNPRVIPPTNTWFGTWDVGAQITWAPTDVLGTSYYVRDVASRANALAASEHVTQDNIEVEVTQMLEAVREADLSITSSARELSSAEEAYRVQLELFNNGRGTSTTLADAEAELTRARLDLLNSKVAARTARIRLDHALGRDVH